MRRRNLSQIIRNNSNKNNLNITIYFLLRALVIVCMIGQGIHGNWNNVMICVLTLVLFTLPNLVSSRFHITLPTLLEIVVYLFIFCAEILGEIQNFYGIFTCWDSILHTLNGFICAAIGLSLVDILNHKDDMEIQMYPLFVALVAFSFSMTVGVMWEFVEFGIDKFMGKDMQKDRIVEDYYSVKINPKQNNNPISVKNIIRTEIYYHNGKDKITIEEGYLDLGLQDTMKDLIMNFLGAFIFSTMGYLYVRNRKEYSFIEKIIPKRVYKETRN